MDVLSAEEEQLFVDESAAAAPTRAACAVRSAAAARWQAMCAPAPDARAAACAQLEGEVDAARKTLAAITAQRDLLDSARETLETVYGFVNGMGPDGELGSGDPKAKLVAELEGALAPYADACAPDLDVRGALAACARLDRGHRDAARFVSACAAVLVPAVRRASAAVCAAVQRASRGALADLALASGEWQRAIDATGDERALLGDAASACPEFCASPEVAALVLDCRRALHHELSRLPNVTTASAAIAAALSAIAEEERILAAFDIAEVSAHMERAVLLPWLQSVRRLPGAGHSIAPQTTTETSPAQQRFLSVAEAILSERE